MGSLHMTIQTAVLIETLTPSARTCGGSPATSSRLRIMRPLLSSSGARRLAAPRPIREVSGVRLEGRDARGVLVVHEGSAALARRQRPTLIVDDGGDATLFVHKALEFEQAGVVPTFDAENEPEEWGVILDTLRAEIAARPGVWSALARGIRGVSEETTTGVHRLYEMAKRARCSSLPSTSTTR